MRSGYLEECITFHRGSQSSTNGVSVVTISNSAAFPIDFWPVILRKSPAGWSVPVGTSLRYQDRSVLPPKSAVKVQIVEPKDVSAWRIDFLCIRAEPLEGTLRRQIRDLLRHADLLPENSEESLIGPEFESANDK